MLLCMAYLTKNCHLEIYYFGAKNDTLTKFLFRFIPISHTSRFRYACPPQDECFGI